MCDAMSGVLSKDRVYWSEYTDSHREIIKEHGLADRNVRGEITILPFEIVPPGYDYSLSMNKWVFRLDMACISRELPSWYDPKVDEARARAALKEWAKSNLVRKSQRVEIKKGEYKSVVVGTVTRNYGTVTHNYGTVTGNVGTVTHNDGTVTRNYGTVTRNYGTVTRNYGTVTGNYGTVTRNYGTVTGNVGTVTHNDGTVISYTKKGVHGVANTAHGVIVNRSGSKPEAIVGVQKKEL